MKPKAWFGWRAIFPLALWAEKFHARRHGHGCLRGYLSCKHPVCVIGRWADRTAHILGEVNYGSWWV